MFAAMVALSTTLHGGSPAAGLSFRVAGLVVTPHVRAPGMRYRRDPGPADGALVRVILTPVKGRRPWARKDVRFFGRTGGPLVEEGRWAWCDFPGDEMGASDVLRPGERTVLTFNTRAADHGLGTSATIHVEGESATTAVRLDPDPVYITAATFFSEGSPERLDSAIVHIVNGAEAPVRVTGVRFRQPASRGRFWALSARALSPRYRALPADGLIPAGDTGVVMASVRLERTFTLIEVDVQEKGRKRTIFGCLKAKPETFDISGGWVSSAAADGRSALTHEEFLKTLAGLHVNTAHYTEVPGYSDQTEPGGLFARFPLKRFGELQPVERYDRPDMLPLIHGVEFLGEPQFGGGRPVPPQEVWRRLHPYAPTRLPTTVTHSDESAWRYYAGLSDYPHYDAYRVNAPSPDAWRLYDRWGDQRIAWGAPLETIGEMCRSLREMSRPAATAYWCQGPHHGWASYGGRRRRSPTRDEIRMQAYHALASRITSLYWFNLSLRSLLQFPDTMEELRRIGREIRMLEDIYLRGSAYRYSRLDEDGKPSWDLASIVSPECAALFALDLRYEPDPDEEVFRFGPPRPATFAFDLPAFLRNPRDVFRVDADGVHEVAYRITETGVTIEDRTHKVAIYIAAPNRNVREKILRKRSALLAHEARLGFDPVTNPADLEALSRLLPGT